MTVSPDEFYTPRVQEAQLTGMIKTREPGLYSARLRIPAGVVPSGVLGRIAELARTFGRGEVYLTARLGFEIPGVPAESFAALREELGAAGVALAGCGPRIRSTVACKGTVCPHGNADTLALARAVDREHGGPDVLPHKFKVAVAGCASSCSKPQVNDVGLVGVCEPLLEEASCIGCGVCTEACHLGALRLEHDRPVVDAGRCVACGDCVKACPVEALRPRRTGLDLFAGGRWGRVKQVGMRLASFLSDEEALGAVGRIKRWYAAHGRKGERLGQAMARVGLPAFRDEVLAEVGRPKWIELTPEAEARFRSFP